MTMQDAKDRLTDAIDGALARMLRSAALAIILGLSGWAVKTTSDHSVTLAAIGADVKNLAAVVASHDSTADADIGRIVAAAGELRNDVTRLQEEEEMRERADRNLLPRRVPSGGP